MNPRRYKLRKNMKFYVTDTLCVDVPIRSGIAVGFSSRNFVMRVVDPTLQLPSYDKAHDAANTIADAVQRKIGSCSIRAFGAVPIDQ